jgi:hypothetical protein
LRADEHDGIADAGADIFCQVLTEYDGGKFSVGRQAGVRLKRGNGTRGGSGKQVAYSLLLVGENALDERAAVSRAAGYEDLFIEAGRGGDDVRQAAETVKELLPVSYPIPLNPHELDVCRVAEEAVLEFTLHAVGDGESDDESGYSCCDSGDGDGSNDSDDSLTPLGSEVTCRKKEFKSHFAYFAGRVKTVFAAPMLS